MVAQPTIGIPTGAWKPDLKDTIQLHSFLKTQCKNDVPINRVGPRGINLTEDELINLPNVDIFEVTDSTLPVVLRRYTLLIDYYLLHTINPVIPELVATWKQGSRLYIKTSTIPGASTLDTMLNRFSPRHLCAIMSDICYALNAAHNFGVSHLGFGARCVVVSEDMSNVRLTQFACGNDVLSLTEGIHLDTKAVLVCLSTLATHKFMDISEAMTTIQREGLSAGANVLRSMAIYGACEDKKPFLDWYSQLKHNFIVNNHILNTPIDCSNVTVILHDIHTIVRRLLFMMSQPTDERPMTEYDGVIIPMFHAKNSPGRGIGACTEVVHAYMTALTVFPAFERIGGCDGLWPSLRIFSACSPDIASTIKTQFWEIFGYMLGYALMLGLSIHIPLHASITCLIMGSESDFHITDMLLPQYQASLSPRRDIIKNMRHGFAYFRTLFQSQSHWPVQQLYCFLFENDLSATLKESPASVIFRGFRPEEEFMMRACLSLLNAQESADFMVATTGSPLIIKNADPIIILKGTSDCVEMRISVCARTVVIPPTEIHTSCAAKQIISSICHENTFNTR